MNDLNFNERRYKLDLETFKRNLLLFQNRQIIWFMKNKSERDDKTYQTKLMKIVPD